MRLEQLRSRLAEADCAVRDQHGTTTNRRVLLTEVVVDGVTGWGECVAGEARPSPETTVPRGTSSGITRRCSTEALESASQVRDLLACSRHNRPRLQSSRHMGR